MPRRQPTLLTWPRLAAGFLVLLVVWALLDLLRHLVGHAVDSTVTRAWIAARQVAQNTQILHTLNATQERAAELVEELERHREPTGERRR